MSVAPKLGSDMGSLISINEAASFTPYTPDFIRQLARNRKIVAVKIGRDWLTTREAVHTYIKSQQLRHEQMLLDLKSAERSLQ